MPTALITGITGQDGSYLAELLLGKGYLVSGTTRNVRRAAAGHVGRLAGKVQLYEVSLADLDALKGVVRTVKPDEIYNLAAQTHIAASWQDPVATAESDALSVIRVLEAVRTETSGVRLFQASSCDMFAASEYPLGEEAPFGPSSPYGAAKAYGHFVTIAYRQAYGMHAVSGVLFNHESPRRDETFVTRKISKAVARVAQGQEGELRLGNLEVRRDWGYAADYVEAMWRMLQQPHAEDFVIGTGEAHSVRDFCERAFEAVGLDYRDYVRVDASLARVNDTEVRVADARRARSRLGWAPTISFEGLVRRMVDADLDLLRRAPAR